MTINLKGKLLDFKKPKIMGILNVTPDSFYDGGKFNSEKKILLHVEKMLVDGADIIDIGGASSRPGANQISLDLELKRVIPAIEIIKKKFNNAIISVDTFRSKVAEKAILSGASIINDISGGEFDRNMFKCVAENKVPYIIMHMKGNPTTMQKKPIYKNVVTDIIKNLSKKIYFARQHGVLDIIIDPGFGFGKTLEHNYQILKNLEHFKELDCPILVGLSRKSMIYKLLKSSSEKSLNGTTSLNTISIQNGASILRVHDVREAKEVIELITFMNKTT